MIVNTFFSLVLLIFGQLNISVDETENHHKNEEPLITLEAGLTTHKVALTFDDLPATHGDAEAMAEVLDRISAGLKNNGAPAIGFVNEFRLYDEKGRREKTAVSSIEQWLKEGFQLGNHTFSHPNINTTPLTDYKNDILKGQLISRPLAEKYGQDYEYFRYPFLRTGNTKAYQQEIWRFLEENGYKVAPVTMDNDEYIYAYVYMKLLEDGEKEKAREIGQAYLAYLEKIIDHYELVSIKHFDRNIPHILLLHANRLNADYIEEVLGLFREKEYDFIAIDEALKDPVYASKEGVHQRGPSWMERWIAEQGGEFEEKPDPSAEVMRLFERLRN